MILLIIVNSQKIISGLLSFYFSDPKTDKGIDNQQYKTRSALGLHDYLGKLESLNYINTETRQLIVNCKPELPLGYSVNRIDEKSESAILKTLCLVLTTKEGVSLFLEELSNEKDKSKILEFMEDLFHYISSNPKILLQIETQMLIKGFYEKLSFVEEEKQDELVNDFLINLYKDKTIPDYGFVECLYYLLGDPLNKSDGSWINRLPNPGKLKIIFNALRLIHKINPNDRFIKPYLKDLEEACLWLIQDPEFWDLKSDLDSNQSLVKDIFDRNPFVREPFKSGYFGKQD